MLILGAFVFFRIAFQHSFLDEATARPMARAPVFEDPGESWQVSITGDV
jgi:hypothetical protein